MSLLLAGFIWLDSTFNNTVVKNWHPWNSVWSEYKQIWSEYLFASKGIKHFLFAYFTSKRIGGQIKKTNKNGSKYSFLSKYFQKEPNINWGLRLVKGFPKQFEAIHSEYSLVCEYLQANIRLYANTCKKIFAWMWNLLKVLQIFASKQIFWSKYPVWKTLERIFAANVFFA